MSSFKVIIIGGGLAGALLANGLINNEVKVTVYERDKEESKREGYQIRLGEPSLSGYRACLTPDHIKTIEQKFGLSSNGKTTEDLYTAPCVYSTRFRPILDLGKLPTYSVSAAIDRVVLRNFLVDPVKTHGSVRFNKAFSRYSIVEDPVGGEKVCVHFEDGSSDSCDVLIAADGSGSKINRQIGLRNIVNIDSHWTFVRKGSLPPKRVKQLPNRLQKGPILLFHNGITLYYALYLPSKEEPDTASNVLFNHVQTEPSFYWSLVVPKDRFKHIRGNEIADYLQLCLECVKDWDSEFTTMLSIGIEDSDSAGVSLIPLRASKKPSSEWRDKLRLQTGDERKWEGHPRVWLIGDAMHAMQPNRGMGGNQSMYDCVDALPPLLELSNLSRSGAPPSSEQVQTALQKYESSMIDRAFTWVKKSGGTSVPNVNLNGFLGLLLSIVNIWVLPLVSVILRTIQAFKGLLR